MILSGTAFKVSNKENLIGVVTYKNLSFGIQIKSVCRKANQKLKVLARLINYFINTQKFLLVNSVAKSQFSYALCYGCFVHVLSSKEVYFVDIIEISTQNTDSSTKFEVPW